MEDPPPTPETAAPTEEPAVPTGPPSPRPAFVIAAALAVLAVATFPPVSGALISLDWQMGDLRPTLYGLDAILLVAAAVIVALRTRVNARFHAAFPTRKLVVFKAISISMSVVIALVLAEVLFRIISFPFNEAQTPSEHALAQFDGELGWSYLPGRSVVQEFGEGGLEVPMHFDAHGVRVGSLATRHDPDAPSVILVGGSFTFGHGLAWEETFAGRLEARAGSPQVVNLGVQGYATDQSLLRLKRHLARFSDVRAVIYTFIPRHIYRNEYADRRLLQRESRIIGTKPLFAVDDAGALRQLARPIRREELGAYSRVVASIRVALCQRGPLPSLALTHALVAEMRVAVEARGAALVVNEWDQWQEARQWSRDGRSLFEGTGLAVVRPDVDAPPGWETWMIPGDGHPDARAHARVAELLAEELRRLAGATPPDGGD